MREDEDWAGQNLLALEVQGPESGTQKVEAKLCKRNNFANPAQHTAQAGQ